MTQAAFGGTSFSSVVNLWLEIGPDVIPLAQVGADFVIASTPSQVPADTDAIVVVSINGHEYRHKYLLADGLSHDNSRSRTVVYDDDGLPF